jgi:hypothetical protein
MKFHPSFTYPIYGEEEKVYGYKDLDIDVRLVSAIDLLLFEGLSFSCGLPQAP